MTPEELARLHASCFEDAPRAWSAEEFEALLADTSIRFHWAAHGFAVVRQVSDEAELLTLAVDPAHRRQGIARAVLKEALSVAHDQGAAAMFLEVGEDNVGAHALYVATGFVEVGRRKDYYASPKGRRISALVMKCDLSLAKISS